MELKKIQPTKLRTKFYLILPYFTLFDSALDSALLDPAIDPALSFT
jgi:hypothetical protein